MLYDLEQGPVAEDVVAIAEKTGRPIPGEVANRPELLPGLGLFYGAFVDLHTCRPAGFGAAAIPYTAIVSWVDEVELVGDQRRRAFYMIHRMDRAFLDWAEKRRRIEELQRERASKKR